MGEREEKEDEQARRCHLGRVMLPWQHSLSVRLDSFHRQHCTAPRAGTRNAAAAARDIARAVSAVLRDVGAREPRFVISPGGHHHHHHYGHQQPHLPEPAVDGFDGFLHVANGAPPSADFEMLLYLNLQASSGVFSLMDGGGQGGGRVLLKLADGRKRSMSLWVEFITASGSLSARKLRSRLLALVAQALERCLQRGRDDVRLVPSEAGEVLMDVRGRGVVRVTLAFHCSGAAWPRCASQWLQQQQQGYSDESFFRRDNHQQTHHQQNHNQQKIHYEQHHYYHGQHQQQQLLKHYHQQISYQHHHQEQQMMMMKKMHQWPGPRRMEEIKVSGFSLLSAEDDTFLGQQGSREQCSAKGRANPGVAGASDGDAWLLSFTEAEEQLLEGGCRRKCLSVLAALQEMHLRGVLGAYHMRTLVLHECEKHPLEADWADACLGERLLGVLLQLVSCLRCCRCPHFFVRGADLLRGRDASELERAAEQAWRLARLLITSPASIGAP